MAHNPTNSAFAHALSSKPAQAADGGQYSPKKILTKTNMPAHSDQFILALAKQLPPNETVGTRELHLTHSRRKQVLPAASIVERPFCRPGRWLFRLMAAAITALGVSISSAAWSDTKNFDLSGFDGISVAQGIHVQVTTGKTFQVIAESKDAGPLALLKIDVKRGNLRMKMGGKLMPHNMTEGRKITVRVTMPKLIHADTSSGADLVAGAMIGSALDLAAANGSMLRINAIDGNTLSVNASSGAEINIVGGICKSLSADISGGSVLDMKDVLCIEAEIDARTGASVSVHAEKITANASTGARILIYGADQAKEINVSSGGEVDFIKAD